MSKIVCPYCGYEKEAEDIFDPNTLYREECPNCDKIFGVRGEYTPTYTEKKLPCANGESHKLERTIRFPKVILGRSEWHCVWCDYTEYRPSKCAAGCSLDKSMCWNCKFAE